jgi:hypothetical protein
MAEQVRATETAFAASMAARDFNAFASWSPTTPPSSTAASRCAARPRC